MDVVNFQNYMAFELFFMKILKMCLTKKVIVSPQDIIEYLCDMVDRIADMFFEIENIYDANNLNYQ